MVVTVAVVDDEEAGRQRILGLLATQPDVEVTGVFEDPADAAEALKCRDFDLVFLDIQMPGMSGLDVVREVEVESMPAVIFVTAWDRYALEAFELNAVDYLLKPVDDDRFDQAMDRIRERLRLNEIHSLRQRLAIALESLEARPGFRDDIAARGRYLERIAVPRGEGILLVSVDEIDWIQADGPYAEIHAKGKQYLLRERMHVLERQLDPAVFCRVHRSAIVQLNRIVSLDPAFHGELMACMRDGSRVPVSRRRRAELERMLGL